MKETTVHITANGKKTATQAVGTIWEFGFKTDPVVEPVDDQDHPVKIRVDRPDDADSMVIPTFDGKAYSAMCALDVEGDFTATVVVTEPDGTVSQLGGFQATATPAPDDPAPADPAVEPTPIVPADPPVDAV